MLMPIGQFARASRLSVKSLRNYDQSGLLPAAFVDPGSGYRYYHISQLVRADKIRSLRMVEMPLSQIAAVLDGDEAEQVLASHLRSLSTRLDELHRKSQQLRRLITQQEYSMSNDVTMKPIPAQIAATYRTATTHTDIFTDIPAGFGHILLMLEREGTAPSGTPFTLIHQAPDAETPGDIAVCVPVAEREADGATFTEIPEIVAASLIHRGAYDDMGESYATVAMWVQERGHHVLGPTREIYLNSPADVDQDDLLTELLFPIDADSDDANSAPGNHAAQSTL